MKRKIYVLALTSVLTGLAPNTNYASLSGKQLVLESNDVGRGGGILRTPMARISLIDANLTDDANIDVRFKTNIGMVEITITDSSGIVHYKTTINTLIDNQIKIDISNLPINTYNITFVTKADSKLVTQGLFDIN